MRLILKVVVIFAVVALLLLLVLAYLENREDNSPNAILDDLKDAGKQAVDDVGQFLEDSGIKQGAADLLGQGAALLQGDQQSKQPQEEAAASPTPLA